MHVVRLVRIVGHDVEQRFVAPVARIGAASARRIVEVVLRDVAEQLADRLRWHAGSESCAKCATPDVPACVSAPPSCSIVTSSCVTVFTTFGPGHEHVRRAAHHVDEVGDRRRIHRAAGARPEDRRDLRHDARRERVAQEDVGVSAERDDAFLDARAAGVVEADHRRAVPHREIHDLADLLGERLGQRSAEHGEVLREDVDQPAVDAAVAGDDAVAVDTSASSRPKSVERWTTNRSSSTNDAFVEQQVEALARGELSFGVLRLEPRLAAALLRLGAAPLEQLELLSHGHGREKLTLDGISI